MDYRPIWMPDTSTINALTDAPDSEALVAGLKSGYFVRFPFTTVAEIVATTSGTRRKELLRMCRSLLRLTGDCIEPHHEIIKIMVTRFEKSLPLGAQHVYLRMADAEDEILRAEVFDDNLATLEREEGRTSEGLFRSIWGNASEVFRELGGSGVQMPTTVAELISQLQQGGAFWNLARGIYDRVATKPADDATIQRFYSECEPFRMLMIAIIAAFFDRCIRPQNVGPSLKAGRNDTFMTTSLPYCDQFITNDAGQLACYKEVVSIAGLNVAICSYDEFSKRFAVLASARMA